MKKGRYTKDQMVKILREADQSTSGSRSGASTTALIDPRQSLAERAR